MACILCPRNGHSKSKPSVYCCAKPPGAVCMQVVVRIDMRSELVIRSALLLAYFSWAEKVQE